MRDRSAKKLIARSEMRLVPLDALRGFAALVVALYHFGSGLPNATFPEVVAHWFQGVSFMPNLLDNGSQMVLLFFSLSGFVFCYTYQYRIQTNKISFEAFAVARISRLLPLAWLLTAVMFAIRIYFYFTVNMRLPTLYEVFSNVLFMSHIVPDGGQPMLGPLWSLTPEIFAYILFFLVMRKWAHTKIETVLYPAFLIVVGLGLGGVVGIWGDWDWRYSILNQVFIMVLPGFFGGVLTCMAWMMLKRHGRKLQLVCSVAALLCTVYCGATLLLFPYLIGPEVFVLACVFFPALFITVLMIKPLAVFLSLGFFKWLGDLSYTIYLVHWPIMVIMNVLNECGALQVGRGSRTLLCVYLAIILVCSHFLHYYFEKPVQAYIRKKYASYRNY